MQIDQGLLKYATARQAEYINAVNSTGSERAGAKQLGIARQTIQNQIQRLKEKAAREGYTPSRFCHEHVEPGFTTKRISTHINAAGEQSGWHIQEPSKVEQQQMLRDFVQGLCDDITPVLPVPVPENVLHDPELMSAIVIGDAHLGCRAFSQETRGHDFDTSIATEAIRAAVDDLIFRSPNAETGVLVDVGDFMHSDSSHNKTFAGTDVDVDTRHYKVKRAAGMVIRYCVDQMLKKYKKVVVVIAKGNHNPNAAEAVQLMVEFYYEKEPRVNILKTQSFFHYIEFGKWLIGVNHGDKVKAPKLVSVMARDMAQAWGRTTHRMWMLGHVHHEKMMEYDGCKVKTFGTLAPPDGWHASMGFASESTMEMITFKKKGGTHSVLVYDIPNLITEPDVVVT